MGRFIGFAILAIVVLFTLAILFRGETVLDDAVSQMRQAAHDLKPIVVPPEPEEEPEPVPKIVLKPFPDITPILGAERRVAYRTKGRYYAYVDDQNQQRPHRKIQYASLEGMSISPVEESRQTSVPRSRAHVNIIYQVTDHYRSETEALRADLLPHVYKELFIFEFAWNGAEWVIDHDLFEHQWANNRDSRSYTARRPAHVKLVEHQFQEFQFVEVPDNPAASSGDNPYGSPVSQTTP